MTTPQTTIKDLRAQMAIIRERQGFTQTQLSKYSGFELSYIQAIENGKDEPELEVLLAIADALEVEIKGLA